MQITWSPDKYDLFESMRQRPNQDLFQHLPTSASKIIDIGCGNGKYSTKLLHQAFPNSSIIAIDLSKKMIDTAKVNLPYKNIRWVNMDINSYKLNQKFDVICLASSFQWLKNHEYYLPLFFNSLTPDGRLLIQMPNMFHQPFYTAIIETAKQLNYQNLLDNLRTSPVLSPMKYDNLISSLTNKYLIWTTTYFNKLKDPGDLTEWAKGAPLRPVISMLNDDELNLFLKKYSSLLEKHYVDENGIHTILPFKRIFLVVEM